MADVERLREEAARLREAAVERERRAADLRREAARLGEEAARLRDQAGGSEPEPVATPEPAAPTWLGRLLRRKGR
jgi:hypothetical protein